MKQSIRGTASPHLDVHPEHQDPVVKRRACSDDGGSPTVLFVGGSNINRCEETTSSTSFIDVSMDLLSLRPSTATTPVRKNHPRRASSADGDASMVATVETYPEHNIHKMGDFDRQACLGSSSPVTITSSPCSDQKPSSVHLRVISGEGVQEASTLVDMTSAFSSDATSSHELKNISAPQPSKPTASISKMDEARATYKRRRRSSSDAYNSTSSLQEQLQQSRKRRRVNRNMAMGGTDFDSILAEIGVIEGENGQR